MSPECNVFCIDNSEYMRNADYTPTRYHAFYDCIHVLVNAKSRDNYESTFALMSLTGLELLCSTTTDKTKILSRVHTTTLKGQCNLVKGLKTAELLLDQRENKHHRKRITALIGSPLKLDGQVMSELACAFMERDVLMDFIVIGQQVRVYTHRRSLQLICCVILLTNHIIVVPPGECLVTCVKASELLPDRQRAKPNSADMDLDADPDLAEAIRLSMQDVVNKNKESNEVDPLIHDAVLSDSNEIDIEGMTEEQQIEWAMRLSMKEAQKKCEEKEKPIIDEIEDKEMTQTNNTNQEHGSNEVKNGETKNEKMDED